MSVSSKTRRTVDQKSTGFRWGSWIKRESFPFPRAGAHLVLSPYFAGKPPPGPDLRNLKSRDYLTRLKSWRAFLVAQTVKNPPAMWETWVQSLEDPLEEGMATHSSILAWRIPMAKGAWQARVHGVAKSWT